MSGQPSGAQINLDATNLFPHDLAGNPSGLIIERAAGMILHMNIVVGGNFVNLFANDPYTVNFYAESIGPGPEVLLTSVAGNLPAALGNPTSVVVHSPVVAGAGLPADGLYKITAAVTMTGAPPAVAFVEGPVIQITT